MITVSTTINTTLEKVWDFWTNPLHILNWNFASPEWHCPQAKNNLQEGQHFVFTMASKNGDMSFDFCGTYTKVERYKSIEYILDDNRKVFINFSDNENIVTITQKFEPEIENPQELQKNGWQAIMDNYKQYVENF